jgi:pimeloyl-ACP methyl ester carboxylesterase
MAEKYMGINATIRSFHLLKILRAINQLLQFILHVCRNNFMESLENADYSDQLYKIKIPSLLLWGQYDFVVPPNVGQAAMANLGSSYKKLVLFSHSGHHPMETETNQVEDEIINFVETFK